ncbi:MAG: hypothetical protein ACRDG7_04010 [Candidatus Limnocylindria bacterium]
MSAIIRRSSVLVALTVLVTACGQAAAVPSQPVSEQPSPTAKPTASPTHTPTAAPTAPPTATPTPAPSSDPDSPTADAPPSFAWGDSVRVTADGLAVRRDPYTHAPFVRGLAYDPVSLERLPIDGDLRLTAGHQLIVNLGPLVLDGIPWYRVHTGLQPGETSDEMITWDADGDGEGSDSGWIAGGSADDPYLEATPNVPEGHEHGPSPLVSASGVGNFTSQPFTADYQVGGSYALSTRDVAPCMFRVVLRPTGEDLVNTGLEGLFAQDEFDSSATSALPAGEYVVEVESGVPGQPAAECPWTLVVVQNVG